jgi:hypothetical protein
MLVICELMLVICELILVICELMLGNACESVGLGLGLACAYIKRLVCVNVCELMLG